MRRQDERDRDLTHAWLTANLVGHLWSKGKLPELAGLIAAGKPRPKVQTVAEQRAALTTIAGQFGLTLRKRRTNDRARSA